MQPDAAQRPADAVLQSSGPKPGPFSPDLRNVVSGKIERNDPEQRLSSEIDVYVRYNWALGQLAARVSDGRSLRVLELGCGLGWFGRVLSDVLGNVAYVGVDLDADAIEEAKRRSGRAHAGTRFLAGDVCALDALDLEPQSFDAVVWFENLEHVEPGNFVELVQSVERYVRPGGVVLVETPNRIGGGGLHASGPMATSRGQHNPHHFLELTLAEVRFLFPGARIVGYEVASALPRPVRAGLRAIARAGVRLNVLRFQRFIDDRGTFTDADLCAQMIASRLPGLNRCFLISHHVHTGGGVPFRT